ncbi:unnamed protein product [Prunus armeniaca]
MPEECYSGALSEQQEVAAVTFHNLTEAETSVMERYLSMKQGPTASQVLQRNPKFKSLFDQLGFGPQAREAAAVALMNISAESNSHRFTAQPQGSFLGNDNAIVFTDEDMEVPYSEHRRPLYLEGQINDVFIRRALVDTGSSINILPLSVLTAAGIPLSKIVQSQTNISGFENKSEVTVGHLQVNLKGLDRVLRESPEYGGEVMQTNSCGSSNNKAPMPCVFQEPMTAPRHMQDGSAAVAEQLETIDLGEDPSAPDISSPARVRSSCPGRNGVPAVLLSF